MGFFVFFSLPSKAIELGQEMPSFRVSTGDDQVLEKPDLLGSINVIFYEDRWSVKINSSLKYALEDLVETDRKRYQDIRLVQIVDASSANIFTGTIWKQML